MNGSDGTKVSLAPAADGQQAVGHLTAPTTTSSLKCDFVDGNGVLVAASVDTLRLGCQVNPGFEEWAERAYGFKRTDIRPTGHKTTWRMPGVGFVDHYQYVDGRPSFLNLEYRPQEDDPSSLLGTFLSPLAVRRVDIALDYGSDFSGYVFDAKRLQRREYRSSQGKLDTLYLGAAGSAKQFRIYDKASEVNRKRRKTGEPELAGPLWRIEAELRSEYATILPNDLFDGLVVRTGPSVGKLKWSDAASLYYAMAHPGIHRSCSKRTRDRVEALIDQYGQPLDPAPSDVYRACLPYLKNGIAFILAMGGTCQSEVAS